MLAQMALEAESTLIDRFQTTLPSPVRQALHLGKKTRSNMSSNLMVVYLCSVLKWSIRTLCLTSFYHFLLLICRDILRSYNR